MDICNDREVMNVKPSTIEKSAMEKVMLLQAIAQLDMLVEMFQSAPERVKKSAVEFRDALKEWAQ